MEIVNQRPACVSIDPALYLQQFEGWGTSLCWWANVIGKWHNESKIDEIADLLFSAEKGLAMNIVRYNMGGGENPPSGENFRIGADIPCYQPESGIWNWNADAGQRKILFKAKDRGVEIFEAFSNTPPAWMTKNYSTAGADDRRNNLMDDHYRQFADFVTEVIKHFRDEWGITFRTLSLFNEPISCWWHSHNDQEGCFFDTNKQIEIMIETISKLKTKGLAGTTLAAPEGWSVFDSIYAYGCYNEMVKPFISQINTHAYFGDKKSRLWLKHIAEEEQKRLWMSEVSIGGSEPHQHNDMCSALELGKTIRDYLMEMNAVAWVYWQAVEDEAGNHNHGLIHANFSGTEEYWVTKQYYAFAQFSKFIRKRAIILDCSCENLIAAFDKDAHILVIVVIHTMDAEKEYLCDFSSFKKLGQFASVYRTSALENLVKLKNEPIIDQRLKIKIVSKSISTYLISDVES